METKKKSAGSRRAPRLDMGATSGDAVLTLLGRRGSRDLLTRLEAGKARYSELKNAVPGITEKTFAQRLKEFDAGGFVTRTVVHSRPPETWYELTEKGSGLQKPLAEFSRWTERFSPSKRSRKK